MSQTGAGSGMGEQGLGSPPGQSSDGGEIAPEPDHSYLRLLLVLLGTATFFEGYDSGINAVVLKDLAETFNVSLDQTGQLSAPISVVGLGAFGAMAVTTLGDRFGRRPLLISTTLMYALFTGLTATSGSLTVFVIYQFLARTFLIAEYATAVTMVAEEFPAERRGRAMGLLAALGALGLPVVAVLNLLVTDHNPLGWRALYLIGLIPLVVVAFLRLKLRETKRWLESRHRRTGLPRQTMLQALALADRPALAKVSAVYFLSHFALLGAATWWPYYAQVQRDFSDAAITVLLAGAYPLGILGSVAAGKLQDRFGRRPVGAGFLMATLVFTIAVFQMQRPGEMFPALALAVFFGLGVAPVLNAVASELFPTEIRATAVACARSVFGTLGSVAGPLVIGLVADRGLSERFPNLPVLGDLGNTVTVAAFMYVAAAAVLLRLPETAGRELEAINVAAAGPGG